MKYAFLLAIITVVSCSVAPAPILNFTVSGKLTFDDVLQDTLLLDSSDIKIAAFLRKASTWQSNLDDILVSNKATITRQGENAFILNIATDGLSLEQNDRIIILGYFQQDGDGAITKTYVRSDSSCPVFKGISPEFIYAANCNDIFYNYEAGWNVKDDGNINVAKLSGVLFAIHF